jgi:hypothetical protein
VVQPATGGRLIKCPPPSARAQSQLSQYTSWSTCRWRRALRDPTLTARSNQCFCSNAFGSKGRADDIDCGITLDAAGAPLADDGTPDCGSGPEAAALGICGWRNAVYEIRQYSPSTYRGCFIDVSVRAAQGQLSALSVSPGKYSLYGALGWTRMALNGRNRRFPARAGADRRAVRARRRHGPGRLGAVKCP